MESSYVSRLEKNMDVKKDKIIVYTCITGNYELPVDHSNMEEEIEYICFSDDISIVPSGWKYLPIQNLDHLDNKDKNRYIKFHPNKFLPKHEYSIYIDFNIQIVKKLSELVDEIKTTKNSIFMYEHFNRQCAYEEARRVVYEGTAPFLKTKEQVKRYELDNFPRNFGLFEANVIVRKNTLDQEELMEKWWKEYKKGSKRDQISLMYSCFKKNVQIESLGESILKKNNKNEVISVKKDYFILDLKNRKRKTSINYLVRLFINRLLLRLFNF